MTTEEFQLIEPTHHNLKEVARHIIDNQIEGGNVTNDMTTAIHWWIERYYRQYPEDFVRHRQSKPRFDQPIEYVPSSDDDDGKLTMSLSEMEDYDGDDQMTTD